MKHLEIILKEMHDRVGAPYTGTPQDDKWYLEYSWTIGEEEHFKEWLRNYMKKNAKARRELMTIESKAKYYIDSFVNMFILMYGWKHKQEDSGKEE